MAYLIIVGGGAIGLSLAYHLAKAGQKDILLLERHQLTSGTSWHAAGIVGPLRATPNMTKLAMQALTTFNELEHQTGLSTGYRQTGGYWLARKNERLDELKRIEALAPVMGLEASLISPSDLGNEIDAIDLEGIIAALKVAADASVNPVDLCQAYARAARAHGVTIQEKTEVAAICHNKGRATGVQLQDGTKISAKNIAITAGAWSKTLTDPIGVALPIQAVEHMYIVSEPMPQLKSPFPVLRDLDRGIYVKGDAGRLVIGGFEPNAKLWDPEGINGHIPFLEMNEDWEHYTPFMEAALELIPDLKHTGIQHFMNGPESFTSDSRPLIGETPEIQGLYVAAGMNSVGIMSSAGVGMVLADWIIGRPLPFDCWEIDIARADPKTSEKSHMEERMSEAVADVFALHWPFKQPVAGRNIRQSSLHECWAAAGAQFGVTAGWERGLYYAQTPAERHLPYSVGEQHWQAIADREAQAMAANVALIDLSPFTKIDISGRQALAFLNHLCCSQMDIAIGRARYTQMLNEQGGIEADITVTRIAEDHFRITSGAATRWRDLAWVNRHQGSLEVMITDCTEKEAVIGVMGAKSRDLLNQFCDGGFENWQFSTMRQIKLAGIDIMATRLSFVGEMGWELSIRCEHAKAIFEALKAAGAGMLGHHALNGCRMEKGYRHWGYELGPLITPIEAGLEFTITYTKEDFIGREALLEQRENGIHQKLYLFQLQGDPLILHDEPIMQQGKICGLTTSGARGGRTGLTLAFGMVDNHFDPAEKTTVNIAGVMCEAIILDKAPYDPKNSRMRS